MRRIPAGGKDAASIVPSERASRSPRRQRSTGPHVVEANGVVVMRASVLLSLSVVFSPSLSISFHLGRLSSSPTDSIGLARIARRRRRLLFVLI